MSGFVSFVYFFLNFSQALIRSRLLRENGRFLPRDVRSILNIYNIKALFLHFFHLLFFIYG